MTRSTELSASTGVLQRRSSLPLPARRVKRFLGMGLSEQSLDLLQAPVIRVTGFDTPMPYSRQEQLYLPQVADIVAAVNQCMSYR